MNVKHNNETNRQAYGISLSSDWIPDQVRNDKKEESPLGDTPSLSSLGDTPSLSSLGERSETRGSINNEYQNQKTPSQWAVFIWCD